MASEALKKFADELKLMRESKSISLQQIAVKTKIDLKFLQAIEEANFDVLPEIYIRAFIKEYSQTIDLNSKETIQKFDNAKVGRLEEKLTEEVLSENSQGNVPDRDSSSEVDTSQSNNSSKEFNSEETITSRSEIQDVKVIKPIKTNYIIGGVISVVAILIVYFSFLSGSSSEIIQVTSDQNGISSKSGRFELEKQSATLDQSEIQTRDDVLPPAQDSLRLAVLTTDRVWLKISCDGKIIDQGIYEADSKLNFFAAKNFSISIGNAGRVKVYFNNNPVENVGKPGEIRNLFITSDGIKYYTIPPPKNEEKPPKSN